MAAKKKIRVYCAYFYNGTLSFVNDTMELAWDHARHCSEGEFPSWGRLLKVKFSGVREHDADTRDLGVFFEDSRPSRFYFWGLRQ